MCTKGHATGVIFKNDLLNKKLRTDILTFHVTIIIV